MEFYDLFGFLKIMKESVKILQKSWKFMAPIALISLIIPSIFFCLFIYSIQHLIGKMNSIVEDPNSFSSSNTTRNLFKYEALILAIEMALAIAFLAISVLSAEATILISAISYTNKPLSWQELFSGIKRAKTRPLITTIHISRRMVAYFLFIGVLTAVSSLYPNLATICIAIFLGIASSIFFLYLAVVWSLALVVSVIEDGFYGKIAIERAAKLVQGQRMDGFMLNLFFNFLTLVFFLCYWMMLGNKGFENMTIYGLFVLNVSSLVKAFLLVAYTVLYFECKKSHGEETDIVFEGIEYTKLPLAKDIP